MNALRRIQAFLVTVCVFLAVVVLAAQEDAGSQPPPGTGGQPHSGEAWAVLIGINRYQHPRIPKLRYAVNDTRAVERALLSQGFRQERILTLTDDRATKPR